MTAILENGNPKRRVGRKLLYGGPTQRFELRVPQRLAERLTYEVNLRNMRDHSATKWTPSRVIVEELARLWGVDGVDFDGGS